MCMCLCMHTCWSLWLCESVSQAIDLFMQGSKYAYMYALPLLLLSKKKNKNKKKNFLVVTTITGSKRLNHVPS